jgi:predicted glycosyltransferase
MRQRTDAEGEGAPRGDPPRGVRVALYSHDAMGIGHIRRNLLIAQKLAGPPHQATVLMIAGTHQAGMFPLPPGVDWLTLPALCKQAAGRYRPRSLDLSLSDITRLRETTIAAALEVFSPDVFIVDKLPRGLGSELDLTLHSLRAGRHTRCVLGLREVLDDPASVEREWKQSGADATIRACYDAVWIYGDPAVYDPVQEYRFSPAVANKSRYVGYLDPRERLRAPPSIDRGPSAGLGLPPGRLMVCVVGGGEDGAELAEAFVAAELPAGANAVLVTGPFMPPRIRQRLQERVAGQPRRRVLEFLAEPEWLIEQADRVICMGGYNTVCEVLSYGKPALIVPRTRPRSEQSIRAERLRRLGLADVLLPDHLSPQALTAWLGGERAAPRVRERIDLGGLARLPGLLEEVLTLGPAPASLQAVEAPQEAPSLVPY